MNKREQIDNIMQSPDCEEIIVKKKMIDEFGEQQVTDRVIYRVPTAESDYVKYSYVYTGDTTNWALEGITEELFINGILVVEEGEE